MDFRNLPHDLNLEVLLDYLGSNHYKVEFCGPWRRNVYNDILETEHNDTDLTKVRVSRKSLYNVLPESLFHHIDLFGDLPESKRYAAFLQEFDAQEEEKRSAYVSFAPIDLMLLSLRQHVRKSLEKYVTTDSVIQEILADRVTEKQRENPFIRQTIPFLPRCKDIRGDVTLITLLLRKVFAEEGIRIYKNMDLCDFHDENPRYKTELGEALNESFLGEGFQQQVLSYNLTFWPAEHCDEDFLNYANDVEEFRLFFEDYFLGVGTILNFNLVDRDSMTLRLSDDEVMNYLNYNTTI